VAQEIMNRLAINDVPGLDGTVRDQVYAHVFGNADREVGGVLIGRVARQSAIPLVTASIAAASAEEGRSELTFTQDAWEHVHRVLARDFPSDQIVGWYHSHPGFGVFLSEHDLFIHRNFFSGTSQIALVVDPLKGQEGVFGWQDEQVAKLYDRPTARPGLGASRPRLDPRTIVPSPGVGPPAGYRLVRDDDEPPPLTRVPAAVVYLLGCALAGVLVGAGLWEILLRGSSPGF
jgi:proteasome lid subunit RPN8/RPN11